MMNGSTYIPFIFLILAITIAFIFFSLKKIKVYPAVTHLLSFVLLFCIVGITGIWVNHVPRIYHLILLISFFLLGTLHIRLMHKFLFSNKHDFFLAEALFTLLLTFLGGAGYLLTYQLTNEASSNWITAGSILPFLLPFLIVKSFFLWKNIPDKIYYVWQYLDHLSVPEAGGGEVIILHFRIAKDENNTRYSRFTVRAPINMKVGDVFHYFLYNYNKEHPDNKILTNSKTSPFGWYFFTKPAWWKKKEMINPNISVYRNQLKDDVLIYAKRVYLGY